MKFLEEQLEVFYGRGGGGGGVGVSFSIIFFIEKKFHHFCKIKRNWKKREKETTYGST